MKQRHHPSVGTKKCPSVWEASALHTWQGYSYRISQFHELNKDITPRLARLVAFAHALLQKENHYPLFGRLAPRTLYRAKATGYHSFRNWRKAPGRCWNHFLSSLPASSWRRWCLEAASLRPRWCPPCLRARCYGCSRSSRRPHFAHGSPRLRLPASLSA